MNPNKIPVEVVRFLLAYDRATGKFSWKVNVGGGRKTLGLAGAANTHSKGYVLIGLFGKRYLAHRLAWVIVKGEWPSHEVDHRNGKPEDNRWCNLRKATPTQQRINSKLYATNTSGFKGVYFNCRRDKWYASITRNHKSYHLGTFSSAKAAAWAYNKAARRLHAEWRRH